MAIWRPDGQVDKEPADLYAIVDDLDFLKAPLARGVEGTGADGARDHFGAAGLVIEVFWAALLVNITAAPFAGDLPTPYVTRALSARLAGSSRKSLRGTSFTRRKDIGHFCPDDLISTFTKYRPGPSLQLGLRQIGLEKYASYSIHSIRCRHQIGHLYPTTCFHQDVHGICDFKSKAIEVDHLELLTLRTNNWYWNRFWRIGPASAHRSGKNISSIGEMMECNRCPALQCRFAYPN